MDQIKVFLRQAIKYRFWIVIGVAALMPMIAYFAAAGSIKEETATQAAAIKAASSDVKQYENGILPNDEYKTLVEKRTEVLNKDINQAWRLLYNQQEPLLKWPEEVSDRFSTWGRQWPEDVDVAAVQQTILDYIQIYPRQVDEVYAAFRPFDYVEGTGVVVAPVKESLLRPAGFDIAKPPTLGQVWGAQQKLWIQSTVLDVIDKVNKSAKDWDTAPVKEITGLEVANQLAQDQKSMVNGEVLELAPEIVKPGSEAVAVATTTSAATSAYGSQNSGGEDSDYASMMSSMYGGSDMMGGKGANSKPEDVYVFKAAAPTQPFQVVPVFVSVLIDQRRILDLISAFENSPMDIQIVDFEMSRPQKKVEKPEKGQMNPVFAGYGMMGGESILGGYGMMSGYGDSSMSDMYAGMNRGGPSYGQGMGMGMGYGMGSAAVKKKTGTDIKSEQLKKLQAKNKDATKEEEETKSESGRGGFSDPYYDVVEVKLYGQARFFNPPPPLEPEVEPTDSAGLAGEEVSADAAAAAGDASMPADAATEAAAPATNTEPASETPAVDEPAPAAAAPEAAAAAVEPTAEPGADPAPADPAPVVNPDDGLIA